jgi:amino acid adenylation domain-containing protein
MRQASENTTESFNDDVIEGFRLSLQQKRLWRRKGWSRAYRAQCAIRMTGEINSEFLRRLLASIIDRHEILRTSFHRLPDMDLPLQVIDERPELSYREIDLFGVSQEQQDAKIDAVFEADGLEPFDLEKGPILRCTLLRMSPRRQTLLISLPALCADAVTFENLVRELGACSPNLAAGVETDPVQYVDYVEWQHESFAANVEASLVKPPAAGVQRASMPVELAPSTVGEFAPVALPVDPFGDLYHLARESGVKAGLNPAEILLCSWIILLRRTIGERAITVGVLNEGRALEPLQSAMGLFAHYIPYECRFPSAMEFVQAAAQIGEDMRRLPLQIEQMWKEESENRTQESLPYTFDYQDFSTIHGTDAFRCTILRRYICIDRFKLKLAVARSETSSAIILEYDPAYYLPETVERLAAQFRVLVRNISVNPRERIDEIDVLDAAERKLLLENWNATTVELPVESLFHGAFESRAEKTPDAIAVVMNDEQVSYGELNRRANQLARYLIRSGVEVESCVGLLMERSPKIVERLLAIMKSGAVYVPLDPFQPRTRLELLIAETGMTALIVSSLSPPAEPFESAQRICPDLERFQIEQEDAGNLGTALSPDNLAYIIFTSGSTGRPKGVTVRHGAAINYAIGLSRAVYENCLEPPLSVSLNAPFVFDASIKQLTHLLYGHRLVMIPEDIRRDAERMLAYIRLHGLDTIDCTPTHLKMLRAAGFGAVEDQRTTRVLVGGEAIDEKIWAQLAAEAGREYFNHYGPTECTVNATICRVEQSSGGPSIGRPIANTRIYLVNESLQPTPIGATGELLIGGAGVSRGYLNHPEWTAENFIPDPFSRRPGERMYRSGDLARYCADGMIAFAGRCDFQVKIRGHRIELGEIEAILSIHPKVREAVVTVTKDEAGGDRLTAYIVPQSSRHRQMQGADLPGELRDYALQMLPDFMTPSAFVELAELPLTQNGKLDRSALPAPDRSLLEKDENIAPRARTLIEEILTGIWAEVLQVEQVTPEDNFFQLGGHSLLATQLISRVRTAFQIDLPLRSLFETSTVAELAERIEETVSAGRGWKTPMIEATAREGALPLSFAQQRMWFLDQLEPGNPAYLSVRTLRLKGALNIAALEAALSEIVRRHEILRTFFTSSGQGPEQNIAPPCRQTLRIMDLSESPQDRQEQITRRTVENESRRSFRLDRLPLLRLTLLRFGEESHSIVISVHHIIVDGWSMNIFARETTRLYEAYIAGGVSPLPELSIQYGDFALWQQRWLSGEALEDQLSYWRRRLTGSTMLRLPIKRMSPATETFRGSVQPMEFSPQLAAALNELSRREGVTFFMTMLTAFKFLLSLYSGQDDVLVGTGIANRNRVEIEPLIGFFVNMLALRTDLSGNPSFRESLKRVREVSLEAYSRQDVPFERLVAELRSEWAPERKSLFQAAFFLQNLPNSGLDLQDITAESWGHDAGVSHFDLLFFIFDTNQGPMGGIEYNTDLFERDAIERMAAHLSLLLEKVAADPDLHLLDIAFEKAAVAGASRDESEVFSFSD